jgi:hypothetical protein
MGRYPPSLFHHFVLREKEFVLQKTVVGLGVL